MRLIFLYKGGVGMKTIALILVFIFCFVGCAISENVATPTDIEEQLVEIDDEDWGTIEIEFERRVFISIDKEPQYLGDEMSLVATLVDFQPEDRYTIYWQYSEDELNWINIENEHLQTFTIVIDNTNCNYWWRVLVETEE